MEFISRNILFRITMLVIIVFPLVPEAITPYLGLFAGAYFVLYLIRDKEAFRRFKRSVRNLKHAFSTSTYVFILVAFISLFYSMDSAMSFKGVLIYFSAFVFFVLIKYEINRSIYILPLLRAYFLSNILVAVYHIGQILYSEVVQGVPFDALTQVSVMSNAPTLAYFLLIPLFPALTLYILKENARDSRFYMVVVTTALISIFMTGSRIAIIGVFLGLALLSLLYSFKFLIALIPTGLFLILIPIFSRRHSAYFILNKDFGRMTFWKGIILDNKKYIFFGRGINTFSKTFHAYMEGKMPLLNLELVNHAYNAPLEILMELGIIGLIVAVVLSINMIRAIAAYTRSKKATSFFKVAYVGVMVSMIVLLLLNLIDSYIMDPKIVYSVAILLGIMNGDAKFKGINLV